jgi:hypothetical protein
MNIGFNAEKKRTKVFELQFLYVYRAYKLSFFILFLVLKCLLSDS